jgi:hypothetical protein
MRDAFGRPGQRPMPGSLCDGAARILAVSDAPAIDPARAQLLASLVDDYAVRAIDERCI